MRAARSARMLREARAELHAAFDFAQVGEWTFDRAHNTKHVSPIALALAGLTADSAVTLQTLRECVHNEDCRILDALIDARQNAAAEMRLIRAGSDERILRVWRHADAEENLCLLLQDITDLRRSEAQVHQLANFDTETGLEIRTEETYTTPEGPYVVKLDMDDYRDVDGLKFPFRMKRSEKGAIINIRLTQVKNNFPIDDELFAKPASSPKQ